MLSGGVRVRIAGTLLAMRLRDFCRYSLLGFTKEVLQSTLIELLFSDQSTRVNLGWSRVGNLWKQLEMSRAYSGCTGSATSGRDSSDRDN